MSTTMRAGTGPVALEPANAADVLTKLNAILDGLRPGAPFSADQPDVRLLAEAGQLPTSMLGTAFSALARAGRIRKVGYGHSQQRSRNGGSAWKWEVAA